MSLYSPSTSIYRDSYRTKRYTDSSPSYRYHEVYTPSKYRSVSPHSSYRSPYRDSYRTGYTASSARSASMSPNREIMPLIRDSFSDIHDPIRSKRAPSAARNRTRDELIDSIIFTRTAENRRMPGQKASTSWEERHAMNIDCDEVYPGIILGNAETAKNTDYLKKIGVTHVLNTAERHVPVNPGKYPVNGMSYYGFHVDDAPTSNISRYFHRTTDYMDEALRGGGKVMVNCVMGWSRSASVVAAYLMAKKGMSSQEALETIRRARPIRPNPGFLQQLADYENLINRRPFW